MKRFLLSFIIIASHHFLFAQSYGNEWINYSRQYYRIKISQDGIYRLSYNSLQNAGIPVNSVNPMYFQIFHAGEEQYIYVHGESDGVFHPNDYIEFFGRRNTGWFDTRLFNDPSDQANPNHSLFNDTAVYFLTWNTSLNNRRMSVETDVNFSSYTPSEWFWNISRQDYTNQYFAGEPHSPTYPVTEPEYNEAEGWFDHALTLGGTRSKNLNTARAYANGPTVEVDMMVVGGSKFRFPSPPYNRPDHHLRIQFAGQTIDTIYHGYRNVRISRQLLPSQLGTTNTTFVFSSINSLGTTADRSTIAWVSVKYPRDFNMQNAQEFRMIIPNSGQNKSLLNLTNFNTNNTTAYIYDLTNKRRIPVVQSGSLHQALLPDSPSGDKECYLFSDSRVINVGQLEAVGVNARFTNYNAVPHRNSDYLFITHHSLIPDVNNYALYRSSHDGGAYKPLVADINQLYDQFAYGIAKNPLAIRNFVRYVLTNYTDSIRAMFLVGKAYSPHLARNHAQRYAGTLVPAMGYPSSDILLTAGIIDNMYTPAIPTGRLSAVSQNDVSAYLEKVKQYDIAKKNPEQWMKNVVHFGGGANANEQAAFRIYLNNYANIIKDTLFGANVKTYYKTSSAPIQITLTDEIKKLINGGVSLMTFFGHAAGIGFDISIDHPSEYQNQGKYPFLLANSCFAGDIFGIEPSSSDIFVLIENKGVIGYLSTIAQGLPSTLNTYSSAFYNNLSSAMYGRTIGEVIQQTIRDIQTASPTIKQICYEMTLHGDPAVILNSQALPDYYPEQIFYGPSEVTSELDSFSVFVSAANKGRAVNADFFVELERILPDGSKETYINLIKAPYFNDTLEFRVPLNQLNGAGLNTFRVTLDVYNAVDESVTTNNSLVSNLFIKASSVSLVYPQNHGVVPSSTVKLKASTSYPFSKEMTYIFQIDTTPYFSGPAKVSGQVRQQGGVIEWVVPFSLSDSLVYYWRVSADSISPTSAFSWSTSSFQYLPSQRGWAQSHHGQYGAINYSFMGFNENNNMFEFTDNVNTIQAQTFIFYYLPGGQMVHPWQDTYIKYNNNIINLWSCLVNGLKIAVINPYTGELWRSFRQAGFGQYGNLHCAGYDVNYFEFSTTATTPPISPYSISDTAWHQRLIDFIDIIPNDYYVLISTHGNHHSHTFPEALKQRIESLGSGLIRSLPDNRAYILFGKKGLPIGAAREVVGLNIDSKIMLTDSVVVKWDNSTIKSEIIGPAQKWNSLFWNTSSVESPSTDSVRLSLSGIDLNGQQSIIFDNLSPDTSFIGTLNNLIDANQYPYLQLQIDMKDTATLSQKSPAQLQRWQVLFTGVPETALDPATHFEFHNDTLAEGDNLVLSHAIRNIGEYDMDSLLVKYWIIDNNKNYHSVAVKRLRPHPVNDIIIDTVSYSTRGLKGNNSFWIEVNPDSDQLELTRINNIGELPFFVSGDITNPLLDVTFDGIHILNGDIVSAKPEILISLRDENQFLLMDQEEDTAQFAVYLKPPGAFLNERIYFEKDGTRQLQFIPANQSNKTSQIIYRPVFSNDGTYNLLVQAKDKSENKSGNSDFNINFEVINRSSITEVMNWPNPFSTRTHFVFTLTGSQIPDYFKIQIMTISGRVVREIDINELGPLNIGRNITQYAWDGRDDFGDLLANGIYLYRVITRINDQDIDLRSTEAARYFNSGFGKMYLMR